MRPPHSLLRDAFERQNGKLSFWQRFRSHGFNRLLSDASQRETFYALVSFSPEASKGRSFGPGKSEGCLMSGPVVLLPRWLDAKWSYLYIHERCGVIWSSSTRGSMLVSMLRWYGSRFIRIGRSIKICPVRYIPPILQITESPDFFALKKCPSNR